LASPPLDLDAYLETLIPLPSDEPHALLFEAARYSLLSGGKRLRPLIALSTAAAYGVSQEVALQPAAALELIHTYSLIHDDLPCMDDDALRRGLPTCHKVYGEAIALLAGDFLLTHAFELASTAPDLSPEQRMELVRVLSQRAGAHGMIGGQTVDILAASRSVDWPLLQFMHQHKTGALFTAAFECGGILGGADACDRTLLRTAGSSLGLAFQIVDDLLDDSAAAVLLGVHGARETAHALYVKGIEALRRLSVPSEPLCGLAHRLVFRDS
jgi:geranylgeranyl pyrophosphate synthase